MPTGPKRTVHQQPAARGPISPRPSTTSTVEHRVPLSCGAISYTQAGSGPVLLLIHDLGGTRRTWQHLIPGLARTHTVIAPDLIGHGLSDPPPGDYSLDAHACTMRDLLLTLGHPRASILGHSLGGGIALQAAYQFPERIDRMVLISSGGLGSALSTPAPFTRRLFGFFPALIGHSDARVLADVLRGLTDDQQRRAFLHTARTVMHRRGQTNGAGDQLSLLRRIPLLVAWGANDKTIAARHHRAFAKRVPHAVTAQIPDAGHYPHETAPAQLLSAIQNFLAATPRFRHVETGWVQQLSSTEWADAHPANPPGDASSSDGQVR
jgi:pimeloyl-ACP methyl ester carboxylesterase